MGARQAWVWEMNSLLQSVSIWFMKKNEYMEDIKDDSVIGETEASSQNHI